MIEIDRVVLVVVMASGVECENLLSALVGGSAGNYFYSWLVIQILKL